MVTRYLLMAMVLCAYGGVHAIEVRKMFHHKAGIGAQKGKSIELGSIVLYLDQFPKITNTVAKQGDVTRQIFFLPAVTSINKEVQEVINGINQSKDLPYSAAIAIKSNPSPGMEIILSYNEKLVGVSEPRSFDAISMHKAIAIELYDRKLVKRMAKESRPIIQMAHNSKPQIIIDCGHGGHDTGAIGCNNVKEKDITLAIGLQVADLLQAHNMTVVLTRNSDKAVKLDERTICANTYTGNLFVSIHANASTNKETSGVETYCITSSLFKKENLLAVDSDQQLFCRNVSDKYNQSNKLAHTVHQSLISSLSTNYCVHDRNVRHSVAQVLLGATMPAVLVEVGYLSNQKEAALLAQTSYQTVIAQGIVKGLQAFLETNTICLK